jgi:hypothetical protein
MQFGPKGANRSGCFDGLRSFPTLHTLRLSNNQPQTASQIVEGEDPMQSVVELRKAKRYQLNAPVSFMWAPLDGRPQTGRGMTRDINTFGIYISTDALPPVGARIQIEITLPKLLNPGPGMHLHGEGVVLRCERGTTARRGFAASAQLYPQSADAMLSQLKFSGQAQ